MGRKLVLNRSGVCLFFLLFSLARGAEDEQSPAATSQGTKALAFESYGKLPLSFEVNQGQTDSRVKFLSRGQEYTLFLAPTEAILMLRDPQPRRENSDGDSHSSSAVHARLRVTETIVKMKLVGANPTPQIEGLEKLPGRSHYLIGKDPDGWQTGVPHFAKVKYRDVYPGVDLVFYGNQGQLEYDLIVAAGANPESITLCFQGADQLEIDAEGDLLLGTPGAEIRVRKPLVYQQLDGVRREVSGAYALKAEDQVAFRLGVYDASRPLVIDPVLVFSTYLEGGGNGIAVDAAGNVYVTGAASGISAAFVAKLNAAGNELIYSTHLGGSGGEVGIAIAVDTGGNAYVMGLSLSTDFPTTSGAFQKTPGGGLEAFVTKLNPAGSAPVYSTYLGGSVDGYGNDIAVDSGGNAYVTGETESRNFPTVNPLQADCGLNSVGHCSDAFVTKLDPTGSELIYSTYFGGRGFFGEGSNGIALDAADNAYVTGFASDNFPTTPGAFQTAFGGGTSNAFVAKLNATGSALVYSTYLGGSLDDDANDIAVNSGGNAYVTGETQSPDFPKTNPVQPAFGGGGSDAFVTKLNAAGSALIYSTYLGGSEDDTGNDIAVDTGGNAYVMGETQSTDFRTANPLQPLSGGGVDAFVTRLNPTGSNLSYSTYLGGSGDDKAKSIAADTSGNVYLTGTSSSTDFPTLNPLQPASGGGTGAFVVKIGEQGPQIRTYFAQFGNGEGFSSDIVLTNPSASNTASGGIDFLDDKGVPLSVGIVVTGNDGALLATGVSSSGIASSVDFSIAPLGAVTISTDGQGDLVVGSAVVTLSGEVGGVVRFGIPGIGIAGVGASQPLDGFITPVRRELGGINTGIAMRNTESHAVTLNLTLRNMRGDEVANGTKTIEGLPAGGHLAQFINELFPEAETDDFEGTVVGEADGGKVAATALELGTEAGQFTTLPVTSLGATPAM